jgi:hypothetical protein
MMRMKQTTVPVTVFWGMPLGILLLPMEMRRERATHAAKWMSEMMR